MLDQLRFSDTLKFEAKQDIGDLTLFLVYTNHLNVPLNIISYTCSACQHVYC